MTGEDNPLNGVQWGEMMTYQELIDLIERRRKAALAELEKALMTEIVKLDGPACNPDDFVDFPARGDVHLGLAPVGEGFCPASYEDTPDYRVFWQGYTVHFRAKVVDWELAQGRLYVLTADGLTWELTDPPVSGNVRVVPSRSSQDVVFMSQVSDPNDFTPHGIDFFMMPAVQEKFFPEEPDADSPVIVTG